MYAAVYQCACDGLSSEQRLQRLQTVLSDQQVDLLLCPELFMSGYNVGSKLDQVAESIDGSFSLAVQDMARSSDTAIVYGYPEKTETGLYNSALCIDKNGAVLANHRKLMLPPGFESQYFNPGDSVSMFELNGFKCAVLICYDAEFPESVRAASEAGAQLIIVPTALASNWGVVADKLIPARAFENGSWVMYANHAGNEDGLSYFGGSCIVTPTGDDAARAGKDETVVSAKLDLKAVLAARERLPYLQSVSVLREKLLRS